MKKIIKSLAVILVVFVCLFVLSFIVYFFNLDMKLTSALQPVLEKHYDNIKRERRI